MKNKPKYTNEELKLLKRLLKFKIGGDSQIEKMRKLTYSEKEIEEISIKLFKSGIKKVLQSEYIEILTAYTKEELRKHTIWGEFKDDKIYYNTLINYIKELC